MIAVRLEGITVLADDVAKMAGFFADALLMTVEVREEHYVAFGGGGVRCAIFSRDAMRANTHDHADYRRPREGQSFELNFECGSEADVDSGMKRIEERGGSVIALPVRTDWGHYTGFFADPEGNIHSLFAVVSSAVH